MDHFGIGLAVQAAARIYFQSACRTGRTTSLVECLKDGDRVVCANPRAAEDLRRRCFMRRLEVDVIVVPPDQAWRARERKKSVGRTLFDHSWIEQYYLESMKNCAAAIQEIELNLSGDGTPKPETPYLVEQRRRWGGFDAT